MIPRIIHQIWLDNPLPDYLVPYMLSWRKLHPDWTHLLWTNVPQFLPEEVRPFCEPPNLRNESLFSDATRWAPGSEGQFRSDILRYELLYVMGGVYVDCDFECLKPIDSLISPNLELFAAWETDYRWIGNAILGAVPNNPTINRTIKNLPKNVQRFAGPGVRPNVLTGPQFITKLWANSYDKIHATIFPSKMFYPYLYNELHKGTQVWSQAYAVHHWNNKRQKT